MKKLVAILFLILGLNSSAFALSATDFGLTPFLVYGDHFSLGVETNRWWMLLDPGWSPENNGNTLPSRMLFAGYGFRLYYDYSGVEQWVSGDWKAKTPLSRYYKQYADLMSDFITVHFVKVKGHTGIEGNEIADCLAKEAVGAKLRKKDKEALRLFREKCS